jgi:hypothetical protein
MDTVQRKKIGSAFGAILILLAACSTSQERRAKADEAVRTKATQEIYRICALPGAEREAEINKTKDESGMVIHCGR